MDNLSSPPGYGQRSPEPEGAWQKVSDLVKRLSEHRDQFAKYASLGLLGVYTYSRYFGNDAAASAAIVAGSGIAIPILFEIQKRTKAIEDKLTAKTPVEHKNFGDAAGYMHNAVLEHTQTRDPRIRCLGGSLKNYWQLLENILGELLAAGNTRKLSIEIAMLNPNWSEFDLYRHPEDKERAIANLASIRGFISRHDQEMNRLSWNFVVKTYDHLPYVYGILLGESILYRGSMTWDMHGKQVGGASQVEYFALSNGIDDERRIADFIVWFENSFRKDACMNAKANKAMHRSRGSADS